MRVATLVRSTPRSSQLPTTPLSTLARQQLDAQLAVTAVLHTWTRKLGFHPHIHCIVTAGGLSTDGQRWVERTGFLFHVDGMKAEFRTHLLASLQRLRDRDELALADDEHPGDDRAWQRFLASLPDERRWVVYIQPPLGRPTHVLDYLGRYTHRIAISDHRLLEADEHHIVFRTRGDETMSLAPLEFVGRYLQHVLPKGFRKIRHFGLYAPAAVRDGRLEQARHLCPAEPDPSDDDADDEDAQSTSPASETWRDLLIRLTGSDPLVCPQCGRDRVLLLELPPSRAPPRGSQ